MFIIKLVKMWLGGTPDMVVGTLKISSDLLLSFFFCFVLQRRSAAVSCSRKYPWPGTWSAGLGFN